MVLEQAAFAHRGRDPGIKQERGAVVFAGAKREHSHGTACPAEQVIDNHQRAYRGKIPGIGRIIFLLSKDNAYDTVNADEVKIFNW